MNVILLKPLTAIPFLLLFVSSAAEDPVTPTQNPRILRLRSPSDTSPILPQCSGNNDQWKYTFSVFLDDRLQEHQVGCDDSRVQCDYTGNFGLARYHCCKCKVECDVGQCNDPIDTPETPTKTSNIMGDSNLQDDNDGTNFADLYPWLGCVLVLLCCCSVTMRELRNKRDLRATRQTMGQRRQQQRESIDKVLSAEERENARYELFVTKFHFQIVLPDKSNIAAASLRSNTGKQDEERPTDEEETAAERPDDDKDVEPTASLNEIAFPELPCIFENPVPKDECCICLESYAQGETICVPTTTKCSHVFHEGCIHEWLKTKNRCPLCRVELL